MFPLRSDNYDSLGHGPERGLLISDRRTRVVLLRVTVSSRDPAETARMIAELGSCSVFLSFWGCFFADLRRGDIDVALEYCDLTLRTVINTLARAPEKSPIPETFLRSVATTTVTAVQFLLGLGPHGPEAVRHFVVRPDKIYITASGKLKFSPNLPYDETHMETDSYRYLAPETLRGEVSPNSPPPQFHEKRIAWSLGTVLREMLLLQFPFGESQSVFVELQNIVETRPKPIPASLPISTICRELLEACMDSNPDRRPRLATIQQQFSSVPHVENMVPLAQCTRENKAVALATLCSAQRAQANGLAYLPRELWDLIFQRFLFQTDSLRAWFMLRATSVVGVCAIQQQP